MKPIKNLIINLNMRSIYFLLIVFMFYSINTFSQNKKSTPTAGHTSVVKIETGSLTQTVDSKLTEEAVKINSEIDLLKRTDNSYSSDKSDKLKELRIKSGELNKNTITVNSADPDQHRVFEKAENRNSDNITGAEIFSGNYIVASAAQVEQRGAEAGKIWLIIGVGQADTGISASGDSLLLFSSIDNGVTYSLITSLKASTGLKINRDEIDMEIIESNAGTKYLHITIGYITAGYSGVKKIALLTFDNSGNVSEAPMSIPGYSASSNYYRPRITSDNSTYPLDPYVTVAYMQDSVSGQDHHIMSKFFRVYNPFTMTPVITYFPHSIYAPVPVLYNDFRTQIDVAYFNNSGDTIIFVLSAYPEFGSGVFLYKAHGNTDVYPDYAGTLSSFYAGDEIEFARVASNGGIGNKNIMITYSDNYFNIGDWDQWIYSTQNGTDWTSSAVDFSGSFNSQYGDIIGRRNTDGCFNIAFKNNNSCIETVASAEFRNSSLQNYVFNLNDNFASSILHPKPAFRYVNNDSALTVWGTYYVLYSTGGSNAIRINVGVAIEGLFDPGSSNHIIEDNISFYLHSSIAPYNVVDSAFLHSYSCTLDNAVIFKNAPDGNYYLSVKHRNSLETWSAGPLSLTKGPSWVSYNFVSSASNSYGNNTVLISPAWCFYSGDVNQDVTIDLTDVLQIHNDAGIFLTGLYLTTNLNGDSGTDLTDLLMAYNNSTNFVSVQKP